MSFLNPAFLWVLPATLFPVIVHLFNRRPPKKITFSHIAWLKEAHQTVLPKKKLRELLLLIARVLVVLFLILFFARPVVHTGGFLSGENQNESLVIMMDVSASMGAIEAGRPSLDWAKERLQTTLRKMPSGLKIGLVVYSDGVEQELAPTDERSRITNALQSLRLQQKTTDIAPALKLAYGMLVNQPQGRKTILIVSDMAEHGWRKLLESATVPDGFDPAIRIVLWDAVSAVGNAGVSDVALALSEEGILKGQARFHASQNYSNPLAWILKLNSRAVAQGVCTKNQNGEMAVPLKVQLPEGGFYSGQLELSADAAPFDDVVYVAGRVPKGFRLLLVDGESGLAPSDSETYYLRLALESPRDPRLESIHVLRAESLANESFDKYDAVVLANVADVGSKESELLTWVEKGGGLFLTAGSKWPKPPLVPLRLFRSRREASSSQKVEPPSAKTSFLSSVGDVDKFQWEQISVTTYVPFEKESTLIPLISLKNGDPLLLRKQIGRGFVLCLTTSIDRAWTNLPAKPIFAPLVRELIAALADPLREQTSLTTYVGEPVRLRVPAGVKSVSVIAPDGVASGANINRDGVMEWPAPLLPGLYHVKTDRKETDFDFAANIPRLEQEGDLGRLNEKVAKKIFPNAPFDYVNDKSNKTEALLAVLQGRDMTNPLLAGLFLLFIAETALGFSRRKT